MKYQSNIQEVVFSLKGKLNDARQISVLQRTIGTYLLGSNLRRIHNDGVAVDGSQIGHYDNLHPLYVNPNKSTRKFPTKGKTGKAKFKNGESHKTGYFESYKAYREKIGRDTEFVNLTLWGSLRSNFSKGVIKLSPEKYIHLFRYYPHPDFMLSGWDCTIDTFLTVPYCIYTKKLIK